VALNAYLLSHTHLIHTHTDLSNDTHTQNPATIVTRKAHNRIACVRDGLLPPPFPLFLPLADAGQSAVDWLLSLVTASSTAALERERESLEEALENLDLARDPEASELAQEWSERSLVYD